ncbi:MAG: GNAT family N-acetyltransferase [Acidobacteria bacterium]|nr:GNAT family N-acetyltransferase [Acidobacteriota bacterium]
MSEATIELIPDGIRTAECFAVMRQLRPHLIEAEFVERVAAQRRQGYQLLAVVVDGRAAALAGFRVGDSLSWGRFVYVDDLVTDEGLRSFGYGGMLLDWLVDYCRDNGLAELHLDSGVQRFAAHRLYLRKRMEITCFDV